MPESQPTTTPTTPTNPPSGDSTLVPPATPPDKTGEGPPSLVPAAPPAVPEKYDIKMPEGIEIDAKTLEAFTPLAKEIGLKQADAQKLADFYSEVIKGYENQSIAGMERQQQDWIKEVQADKDFGGAKFEESQKYAQKAVLFAKDPEAFRTEINGLGVGANPQLFYFLAKVGKALSEDTIRGTSIGEGPNQDPTKDAYARMYPTMAKQIEGK